MLQENALEKTDALPPQKPLSQFVDRFHHDADFRALVESDAHTALRNVGIKVPNGVQIQFAASAANAIGMMLDRPADTTPSTIHAVLDDDLLQQVSGGVTATPGIDDELKEFLDLFQHTVIR